MAMWQEHQCLRDDVVAVAAKDETAPMCGEGDEMRGRRHGGHRQQEPRHRRSSGFCEGFQRRSTARGQRLITFARSTRARTARTHVEFYECSKRLGFGCG